MAGSVDASASSSDSSTFGLSTGAFNFQGGNSGTKWLPLALVIVGGVLVAIWLFNRK